MSTDADKTVADLHRPFTGLSRLTSRMRLRNAIHPDIRSLAQTDAWLLSHLTTTGPAQISALAEWQAIDRSAMTAQVKRFERTGLTRRHTDSTNRRASIVTLAEDGEAAYSEIRKEASASFSDVLSDWIPRQHRKLIEPVTRLSTALEKHLNWAAFTDDSGRADKMNREPSLQLVRS